MSAAKVSDNARVAVKSHLSGDHLSAAVFFARSCAQIEATNSGPPSDEVRAQHRSFAIGAVISAVAYLEAAANEVYLAATDNDPHLFAKADARLPTLLAHVWDSVEAIRTLQKYQVALVLAQKSPFDQGTAPFQLASHLLVLRNNLVHYKPEWDSDLQDHKKIEVRLRGAFRENPYSDKSQAFFPHRCLGHGCAAWAVRSAWSFVESFYSRMDLPYWAAGYSTRVASA